jgi:hypothetical protein
MEDKNADYLHVILSSENDEVSQAKIDDVIRLNYILKKITSNFKTACISYCSKGND